MNIYIYVSTFDLVFTLRYFFQTFFTLPPPPPSDSASGTDYEDGLTSNIDSFFTTIFVLLAFSFVPAAWIAYVVREKETKCKHQQVGARN